MNQVESIELKDTREAHLSPLQAIRATCKDCIGSAADIRDCEGDKLYDDPCLFYPFRLGKGRPSVRLIRKYCQYCMGGSLHAVKNCVSKHCPLLPYRMGKNPARKIKNVVLFPPKGHVRGGFSLKVELEPKIKVRQ
jgi:hypothetical protein